MPHGSDERERSHRLRALAVVFGVLVLAGAAAAPPSWLPDPVPLGARDFIQFYLSCRRVLDGEDPYSAERVRAHRGQLADEELFTSSPPTTLLPFYPLCRLDFRTAVRIYLGFNVLVLTGCALTWGWLLTGQWSRARVAGIAWLLWAPDLLLVGMGQTTAWVLAGVTGCLAALRLGRDGLAGALLSLTIMKPHLAVLPVVFLIALALRQRRYRLPAGFVLAVAGWIGLATLISPHAWSQYVAQWAEVKPGYIGATLNGLGRWKIGPEFAVIGWALFGAAVLAGFVLGLRTSNGHSLPFRMAWLLTATLCVVPHCLSYDFALMLPGMLAALLAALQRRRALDWLIVMGWIILDLVFIKGRFSVWLDWEYWWLPWAGLGLLALQRIGTRG